MNVGMGQAVRFYKVDNQSNEAVHVLAAGDAGALALSKLGRATLR